MSAISGVTFFCTATALRPIPLRAPGRRATWSGGRICPGVILVTPEHGDTIWQSINRPLVEAWSPNTPNKLSAVKHINPEKAPSYKKQ